MKKTDVPILTIPGVKPEDAKRLLNVRAYRQYKQMVECFQIGICILCKLDPLINRVITVEGGWRAWENAYRPANLSAAFVLAPIRHITHVGEMGPYDFADQGKLIQFFLKDANYRGGIVSTRFGDAEFCSGSVEHLHTQIMIPSGAGEVKVPVRKNTEELLINYQTALVFEKIRNGATINDLNPEECDLIKGKL